jgi:hypothetical protein
MTAEVGVLNKTAVALAADSAVTVRSGSSTKIFNSVNKLFELSNREPIGIMVYGSAEIARIPWETVIKGYRAHLGKTAFNRTIDYQNAFIDFIQSRCNCFNKAVLNAEGEQFYINHFLMIYRRFWEALDELTENGKEPPKKIVKQIFLRALTLTLEELRKLKDNRLFSDVDVTEISKRLIAQREQARTKIFSKLDLSKPEISLLDEVAELIVSKEAFLSQDYSGVVFAGFGRNENFPQLHEIGVEALLGNKLKYRRMRKVEIDAVNSTSSVIAFAQAEVVNNFMEGIDPEYKDFQQTAMRNLIDEISRAAYADKHFGKKSARQALEKKLRGASISALNTMEENLRKFREKFHWGPIVNTVDALPKDELAGMAEALVNLTSLRRRVSTDMETVGGPVDVAVISKGDGFIWIKRKHYFDLKMNPRYAQRLAC